MMGFAQEVTEVREKIKIFEEIAAILSPDVIKAIKDLDKIDFNNSDQLIKAATRLIGSKKDIKIIAHGLPDIHNAIKIQNQIMNVSDIRDSIGLVAGNIQRISDVADAIPAIDSLKENKDVYANLLAMSDDISNAISMAEDITLTSTIAESLRDEISTMEKMVEQCKKDVEHAANLMNAAGQAERRIDEKIKYVDEVVARMYNFNVDVVFLEPNQKSSSRYSPANNELVLKIPGGKVGKEGKLGLRGIQGKPGIPGTATNQGMQGEPGKDGKDFRAHLFGNKRDMKKYGNRVAGTSFLSLDETPTMVYFKRSDTLNDWTEGQAFGISDGEDANITVTDSKKLGGYTIEQIMVHIQQLVEKEINKWQQ